MVWGLCGSEIMGEESEGGGDPFGGLTKVPSRKELREKRSPARPRKLTWAAIPEPLIIMLEGLSGRVPARKIRPRWALACADRTGKEGEDE